MTDIADEERLLAEIRASPHDDAPRIVYADLLVGRGDERGEYIALSVAGSQRPDSLTQEQWARKSELGKREKEWTQLLGLGKLMVVWRRGLPEVLIGTVQEVCAVRDAMRRLPTYKLALQGTEELGRLAQLPELASVEEITLHGPLRLIEREWVGTEVPQDQLAALCESPHATALRVLEMGEGALSDAGAAILARAPWLPRLRSLTVVKGTVTGGGLDQILQHTRELRELAVWNTSIGDPGASAIANADLPKLDHLRLGKCSVTPIGGRAVLASKNLATVRILNVGELDLVGALGALAESPHTGGLEQLDLHGSYLATADAIAIARASGAGFPQLVKLDVRGNQIDDAGAEAFACSTVLPRLVTLDLRDNHLTRAGVEAFTKTTLPALTSLGVSGNPLPTGKTEQISYYDEGFEVGGATVDIRLPIDEMQPWFADRPQIKLS